MKIGILSDIHDNVWNLRAALAGLQDCAAVLCCGDLCSPFIVGLLAQGLPGIPVHVVFGNNDGDLFRITQNAVRAETVLLHGVVYQGELGQRRIFMNHYPEIATTVNRDDFDLICYGHNHQFKVAQAGETLLVNPGAILGYEPGGQRDIPPTFVVYETATAEVAAYQVVGGAARLVQPYEYDLIAE
jgi:putative phosphoesterase